VIALTLSALLVFMAVWQAAPMSLFATGSDLDMSFSLYTFDGNTIGALPVQSGVRPIGGELQFYIPGAPGWYAAVEDEGRAETLYVYLNENGVVVNQYKESHFTKTNSQANHDFTVRHDGGPGTAAYITLVCKINGPQEACKQVDCGVCYMDPKCTDCEYCLDYPDCGHCYYYVHDTAVKPNSSQTLSTEKFWTKMPDGPEGISFCADLGALWTNGIYHVDFDNHGFSSDEVRFIMAAFDYIHNTPDFDWAAGEGLNSRFGKALAQIILWNLIIEIHEDDYTKDWFFGYDIVRVEGHSSWWAPYNAIFNHMIANRKHYIDLYNAKRPSGFGDTDVAGIVFIKGTEFEDAERTKQITDPRKQQRQMIVLYGKDVKVDISDNIMLDIRFIPRPVALAAFEGTGAPGSIEVLKREFGADGQRLTNIRTQRVVTRADSVTMGNTPTGGNNDFNYAQVYVEDVKAMPDGIDFDIIHGNGKIKVGTANIQIIEQNGVDRIKFTIR
jgi:hypothetical protein